MQGKLLLFVFMGGLPGFFYCYHLSELQPCPELNKLYKVVIKNSPSAHYNWKTKPMCTNVTIQQKSLKIVEKT